jgi:PAS domain-containing protein
VLQHPIELILMRQLASQLSTPVFLVDPDGTLVYFNEPAEGILGQRFDEVGPMPAERWSTVFTPQDDGGHPMAAGDLPLMRAMRDRRPAHARLVIRGLDRRSHQIDVTAFPLVGVAGRFVGAVALFWETPAA